MRLYCQIRNNSICFKTITSASCSSFLDKTCLTKIKNKIEHKQNQGFYDSFNAHVTIN